MPPFRSLARRALEPILGRSNAAMFERWIEHQDPRFRGSVRRLRSSWHNKHAGQRCFILGNGPSLNRTDLSLLKNEWTFGTNRIYLLRESRDFTPSYYVVSNELVARQCAREINGLPVPKFVGWHCREFVQYQPDTTYLWTRCGLRSWFYTDLTEGCWEGSTVTMVCLQLAFYMGFTQVILVGVDHSYQFQGKPHAQQVAEGPDPNHFDPHYFSDGFLWHLPDLAGSEMSYRVADYMFRAAGRQVLDATIGGKLEVFQKVEYHSLFQRPCTRKAA